MCRTMIEGGRRCPHGGDAARRARWVERKRHQRVRAAAIAAHTGILDAQVEAGESRVDELTDARMTAMSWDQLEGLVAELSDDEPALSRLLDYIDHRQSDQEWDRTFAELATREESEQRAEQQAWEAWRSEQTGDGLDDVQLNPASRPGRRLSWRERIREDYSTYTHLQYLTAEADCNGVLLTTAGRARGINPHSLLSGPYSRVRKWASPELREWFGRNGRMTYAEYAYHARGDGEGRAAATSARYHQVDEWS